MTDQHTAAVLIELRRIGVDLAVLPGSLVGTGLRASELLQWLRAIPNAAGADELLRRLAEHARANAYRPVEVRWRKEPQRPAHRYKRERWWPTQSLLDAGTDLLMEEWDPFGIRLAGVDREAVAMFVFHFFGPLLAPNGRVDPITHATEMIASAERDHLALAPSPEPHRRYLARRLAELVQQYPVPSAKFPPSHSVMIVVGDHPSGPPPRDPEGVCARCHAFGTVARLTVLGNPATHTRYCASCWREVRPGQWSSRRTRPETASEQIARLDRMGQPPTTSESRTWDDTLEFVSQFMRLSDVERDAVRAEDLALAADYYVTIEDRMDSPMPPEIETFVRQYGSLPA